MEDRSIPSAPRSALIDCIKASACVAIVWHHLAFYGPMSTVAHAAVPAVIDWLSEYARMAVQIFLVLGGYQAAAGMAPRGAAAFDAPLSRIGKRFVRLVVPYAVALVVTLLVCAAIRPWFSHESVPAAPHLRQLLAHALLLQGIVGEESLSAGVWYVSIDFELFALSTLLLAGVRSAGRAVSRRCGVRAVDAWWPWPLSGAQALVVLGVAASLYGFNRDAGWDVWAVYFFGAYGLGMMAFWAVEAGQRSVAWNWSLLIAALVISALVLDWRDRIALAGTTALLLIAALRTPAVARWQGPAPLRRLGRISYSVFLIHFSVCLLVNAVESHFWPTSIPAAMGGMAAAFVLSIAAGHLLYQTVERHVHSWHAAVRWQAGLVGAGLVTAVLAGLW